MKIKVLTTNIWRYYEWEGRKSNAVNFLKGQNADIVLLQEAAYDERFKENFNDQVDELNKELSYPSHSFHKITKMTKWHKDPIDWEAWYGLGVLSRFNIINSESVILPHIKKDKDFGFSLTELETSQGNIEVINVHFENTDEGSKVHLKYLLDWCAQRRIAPIIAGDFNMKDTKALNEIAGRDYYISFNVKPYFSFMPTEFSHNSEPITLDYIIAHKSKFNILSIDCVENNGSDHNSVIAEIELLKGNT